jgi:HEAT repeat protein
LPEPHDPLELRPAALFILQNHDTRIHLVPKLIPLLQEPDSGLRLAVLSVVEQPDASQLPLLLLVGNDPDAKVRMELLRCLSQMGRSAIRAEAAVLKLCADSDIDVRLHAAWALWKITGQTNTAIPMLESAVSQDPGRDHRTVYQLVLMGDTAPFFVTTLVNSLANSNAGDRAIVCTLLGEIGPPAAAAIPALRRALQDPEAEVRRRAEVALGRIDPEHATTHSP